MVCGDVELEKLWFNEANLDNERTLYDKSIIHLPRQYFPELKKACKMGVSGAKEVKFTTGLPLLQEEKN